jgi:hypothetical protein
VISDPTQTKEIDMSRVTHQTVRLDRGRHMSPSEGACVMELASMLAGEQFSDHPRSVCPVIGSLLRAYNDSVDDSHRQDLYACAAKVVGSASGEDVQITRARCLREWARSHRPHHWTYGLASRVRALLGDPDGPVELAGPRALRAMPRTDETHAAVLALLDDLLAIGRVHQRSTQIVGPDTDIVSPCHDTNGRHGLAIRQG